MKHPRIKPDSPDSTDQTSRRRGSVMLAAVLFTFVFGLVSAWTILAVQRQTRATWQARIFENSLNGAASQLRNMFNQAEYIVKTRPPQFNDQVTNINPAVMSITPPPLPGFRQMTDASSRALSFVRSLSANDMAFRLVNVAPGDPAFDTLRSWNGYRLASLSYDVYTVLSENSANADRLAFPGAGFRKQLSFLYVPVYQYAIFYNGDLELHPGPNMDVRGRVHTNGSLNLSGTNDSNRLLNFWDRVSAVGSMSTMNDFLPVASGGAGVNRDNAATGINATSWPNISYIQQNVQGARYGQVNFPRASSTLTPTQIASGAFASFASQFQNMVVAAGDSRDTNNNRALDSFDTSWTTFARNLWGDFMRDSSRGVSRVSLPLPAEARAQEPQQPNRVILNRVLSTDSQVTRDLKYEGIADLKILGDPGDPDSITIRDRNNNVLSNVYTRSGGSTATIYSVGEFFDAQQNTVVKTIKIDMANVKERFQTGTFNSGNGVLYVSSTPGQGDTWTNRDSRFDWASSGRDNYMPAVQIVNATDLPRNSDGAFTIATDRPLYQAGNFNTANKATAVMAADSITLTTQELTLRTYDPVTGDIIQNGNTWEGNSGAPVGSEAARHGDIPTAATTTLETNAVLITGNTPSKYKDPAVAVPTRNVGESDLDYQARIDAVVSSTRGAGYQRVQESGGAHNVIRYLENFGTGREHDFNGSILALYESRYARNPWADPSIDNVTPGNRGTVNGVMLRPYYTAPSRVFSWDASLASSAPPRGMLFLVVVEMSEMNRISPDEAAAARAAMN